MQVVMSDEIDPLSIRQLNPTGIILSPGPGNPDEYPMTQEIVREFGGEIPILGICLGHQIIGRVFGHAVCLGNRPVHGKISLCFHGGEGILMEIPSPFNITRYHSLILRDIGPDGDFKTAAWTSSGTIMAIAHKKWPIYGVQFHPEAVLTEHGHKLLENFIGIAENWKHKNA